MAILHKSKRLKKELSLFDIYALATGVTLSSGFFLLPGLAAAHAGPAVTISYLIAALHFVPAVFCMVELSTAMPRAGGIYYFLDRSFGPLFGTIGGLGTWLALILKTAFALIGIGAYVGLFLPEIPIQPLAIAFAIIFGAINLSGAKKTSKFQIILVIGLLFTIFGFSGFGLLNLKAKHFSNYFASGFDSIYATAGLVYISYMGLTNIASVSEEVKNPERNLTLGMMLALGTAVLIYGLGTTVMVGILPPAEFHNNLTPVTAVAQKFGGNIGAIVMTIAAILAFFSVSNAAILSASRYPLAMSRDHILPRFFRFLTKKYRTPKIAIYITVGLVILCLVLFEPTRIAKLAGAFQLLLFALSSLAVIIMRESHLASYDPGYRSPCYPWMQIIGIIAPLILIFKMGMAPILFTFALVFAGSLWYFFYARKRVNRCGAIYHVFARLGEQRYVGLDRELRGILQEKGLRKEDPFDMVIARARFIDLKNKVAFEYVVQKAAAQIAHRLNHPVEMFVREFLNGTRVGATPVSHGVALPHTRLPSLEHPELVMVRAKQGVVVDVDDDLLVDHDADNPVYAFFFLVSPEEKPSQHLRLLAQIAERATDEDFMHEWMDCENEQEIKEILHRDEYFIYLVLGKDTKAASMIGEAVRDVDLPAGCMIEIVHRGDDIQIPREDTVLQEGDRLTIIGGPLGIQNIHQQYGEETGTMIL